MELEGTTTQSETTVEAPVLSPEQAAWKQQMDYQFMAEPPSQQVVASEQIPASEIVATEQAPVNTIDYTPFIKETFGLESVDEVKTQWEAFKALKDNPPAPTTAEQEFANEESKRLHELVRTGKFKEANEIIYQQIKIDELTSSEVSDLNADEIIKLGMKFTNKDLTQKEIDFKFRKEFSIPKEPVQGISEDTEDFEVRMQEWNEAVEDIKMSKTIAAKEMKPKLQAAKAQIQFPDILSPQSEIDPEYEAYKASKANVSQQVESMITPAIKALKESDVQLGFKVTDPNNQMDFDVSIAPTPEAFEKARQDSLSFDVWFQNLCYDKDGKFQPQNVQKLILLYNERGNYDLSIARQAVNAERARVIAKETGNNITGKNFNVNVGERTELQKQMDARLS